MKTNANFTRMHSLVTLGLTATTFTAEAMAAPFEVLPQGPGRAALVDNPGAPTQIELIDYGSLTGTGPYTFATVQRGVGGTNAQTWSTQPYIVMCPHAESFPPVDIWVFDASTATGDLQNALNAANTAGGGVVRVGPGTHNITAAVEVPSNTSLILDHAAIMQRGDSALNNMCRNLVENETTGNYGANSNIVIRGGTWDARDTVHATTCWPLRFYQLTGLSILDTKIRDNQGHMLSFYSAKNVRIEDCVFDDAAAGGAIQFEGGRTTPYWYNPSSSLQNTNFSIVDCVFRNVRYGVWQDHAASSTVGCRNLSVTRCNFQCDNNSASIGIKLYSYENFTVTDCFFSDSVRAVYVDQTTPKDDGFNSIIYGNIMNVASQGTSDYGVSLEGANSNETQDRIASSTFRANHLDMITGYGVKYQSSEDGSFEGNVITASASTNYGLYIRNSNNNTIRNNIVTGFTGQSISFGSGGFNGAKEMIMASCICDDRMGPNNSYHYVLVADSICGSTDTNTPAKFWYLQNMFVGGTWTPAP